MFVVFMFPLDMAFDKIKTSFHLLGVNSNQARVAHRIRQPSLGNIISSSKGDGGGAGAGESTRFGGAKSFFHSLSTMTEASSNDVDECDAEFMDEQNRLTRYIPYFLNFQRP